MTAEFLQLKEEDIKAFLDRAANAVDENTKRIRMDNKFKMIRKERAIGLVRSDNSWTPRKEPLDEIAFGTQENLKDSTIPFCAFNSGKDVYVTLVNCLTLVRWVDVGHKSIGVQSLMNHLSLLPQEVLHVGDQMSKTGNDFRARTACCTLWVGNPKETRHLLRYLLATRQPKDY
jgi:IMP and pyridine-specific 5'-nucleotidase